MNTNKLIFAAIAIVVIAAGIYFVGPLYYPKQGGQSNVPAEGNAVNIENFSFNPSILTVKAGTTVKWTNYDSASHTIKSNNFNSESLSKGQTFEFKFENAGSYDYSCGIHPSMKGKIIVE